MISAGYLVTTVAAIFMLSVAASSAAPADPSQEELSVLAEEALDARAVDIPIGPLTFSFESMVQSTRRTGGSVCDRNPTPVEAISILQGAYYSAAQNGAALIILDIEGVPEGRSPQSKIRELMSAVPLHLVRHAVVAPTDAGRSADIMATLPAKERIPNCLRIRHGKFIVTDLTIKPAHGKNGMIDPEYRIVLGLYHVKWVPEFSTMKISEEYRGLNDQGRLNMLVHFDPVQQRWQQVALKTKGSSTDIRMGTINYY